MLKNYVEETWEDNYEEYDGILPGDLPTSIREAYEESLDRDIGSLHEEYC